MVATSDALPLLDRGVHWGEQTVGHRVDAATGASSGEKENMHTRPNPEMRPGEFDASRLIDVLQSRFGLIVHVELQSESGDEFLWSQPTRHEEGHGTRYAAVAGPLYRRDGALIAQRADFGWGTEDEDGRASRALSERETLTEQQIAAQIMQSVQDWAP
ncbi:hypothetical protein [Geodermatophilus nigrescens]|uniref:hypothetical protein n=1 Tax=Geodermatophilus nigrescens TaxID=1070870 RepID=UPI000932E485|nr:hypothetical protein [Geodermatophilus nigrescens]